MLLFQIYWNVKQLICLWLWVILNRTWAKAVWLHCVLHSSPLDQKWGQMSGALKLRDKTLDECSKWQRTIMPGKRVFRGQCDRLLQEVVDRGRERGCSAQSDWLLRVQGEVLRTWTVLEVRREKEHTWATLCREEVFHRLCRWRKEESKVAPLFYIWKMRNLGETVTSETGFWSSQHRGNSWDADTDLFQWRKRKFSLGSHTQFRKWRKKSQSNYDSFERQM